MALVSLCITPFIIEKVWQGECKQRPDLYITFKWCNKIIRRLLEKNGCSETFNAHSFSLFIVVRSHIWEVNIENKS